MGISFSKPGVERYNSLAICCMRARGASPTEEPSSSFFDINYNNMGFRNNKQKQKEKEKKKKGKGKETPPPEVPPPEKPKS